MPDTNSRSKQEYDDKLADFTDQVMDGNFPDDPSLSVPGDDPELQELERTVIRLKKPGDIIPPQSSKEKIRTKLISIWDQPISHPNGFPIWDWLKRIFSSGSTWQSTSQRRDQLIFATAAVIVVVILAVSIFTPQSEGMTGTVEGMTGTIILTVIGLLGLVFALIWNSRRKK
jgi:hypothetical protein